MLRRTALASLVIGCIASQRAMAEAIGPTYKIIEPDMLKDIERTLKEKEKSGELAKLHQESSSRSRTHENNSAAIFLF